MKNGISINGEHFELKAVDPHDLVCDTCDLYGICTEIADKEWGLCSMYDEVSEGNRIKYHFEKKHTKTNESHENNKI